MILFLDFDGVLHPSPNKMSTEFSALPLFEDWLRKHEKVDVIISSSWRDVMDIDVLKAIFSQDLQDRIIDKCPTLPFDKVENEAHWRYKEIMAWIAINHYEGPWLALDDAVDAFPEHHPHLVACNQKVGLTNLVIERLTAKVIESDLNTKLMEIE